MIAIIDYDAGNIKSVIKAFLYLKEEVVLTRDRETILGADRFPSGNQEGTVMEQQFIPV